jgi:hypothetical protein
MLGAGQSKKDAWCISQTHDLRFARLRVFSFHTVSSIGPKTVSAYTVKILSSQKRGGQQGYQSIHLDFVHNRRCFLDTLEGLVFYFKLKKNIFSV